MIHDVDDVNEVEFLVYDHPVEVLSEDAESSEDQVENRYPPEENEETEMIYGSPEAVRYFQNAVLPPDRTDSVVMEVEDFSVRSKLTVRPLSSPDTYVDRHGCSTNRVRTPDWAIHFERNQSEPADETQPDNVPVFDLESEVLLTETIPGTSSELSLVETELALESCIAETEVEVESGPEPCSDSDPDSVVEIGSLKLVSQTAPTVVSEFVEPISSDSVPVNMVEDVEDLYTDEENLENMTHAARVASVLDGLHRQRPGENPLNDRAERLAEAILASALFETVFLQPDRQSTPVHLEPSQETDVPFIGSSLCRIRLPFSGTQSQLTPFFWFSFTRASWSDVLIACHRFSIFEFLSRI